MGGYVVFIGITLGLLLRFRSRLIPLWYKLQLLTPLPDNYIVTLEKYNKFYQLLPEESKNRFEKKVKYFILTKQFIPRKIDKVTDEMKALISSTAVQLTFGFANITLKHFDKILIYPDEYYSVINKQYHKGEVNPKLKAIVVSWKAFVEGFADPHDGINLGLHEMAHALKLENIIQNGEQHFFNHEDYNKWLILAEEEIEKITNGKETIFRQYASVNEDEFFAVCMELFFEQPHKLYEYHPNLYETISNLLRQDTLQLFRPSNA